MLPAEELFWHWRRAISPYFESVPLSDPTRPPQIPEIHMYNAGGFLFMDTKFSGQKFVRDASWLRRNDDSDHVGIQVFRRGRNLCQNGGTDFVLEANGIYAVNLGYEVDALCTDADVLTIVLPRDRISADLPGLAEARGALFDIRSTPGKLLADYMQSLSQVLPVADANEAPVLTQSFVGMMRALLAAGDPLSTEARSGVRAALQNFIDDNLGSPILGVESICAHFRMSRATLYRLFKEEGGVRDYIQRRRLMGVFKALTAPGNMERGVYDIALDYGFSSASYLSTRFREHFGMTPREAREAARSHARLGNGLPGAESEASDGLSDAEIMERWGRQLRASMQRDETNVA